MYEKYVCAGDKVVIIGDSALPHFLTSREFDIAFLSDGRAISVDKLRPHHLQPWQVARYIVTKYTILTVGRFMQKNRPSQQRRWIKKYLNDTQFVGNMQMETGGLYVQPEEIQVFVTGVLDNLDEELRHCYVE